MAKAKMKQYRAIEKWNTRYGTSRRVTTRKSNGRFVDNVSLTALTGR